MFGALRDVLTGRRRLPATPPLPPAPPPEAGVSDEAGQVVMYEGAEVPGYPGPGVAVPAIPPEVLLRKHEDIIDALHQASALSTEDFRRLIRPALVRYAAFVHLLPASESHHHCGQGGLLRHGLEVACYAAAGCEAKVFALDKWPSERHHLTPRYRIAALFGGLCHDLGKPIADIGAIDVTGTNIWEPHAADLWDWLQGQGMDRYHIHWRPGARHRRHETYTLMPLYRILPEATRAWMLEHRGVEPFDAMVRALTPEKDTHNPLADVITAADSTSVDRDLRETRKRLSAGGLGGRRGFVALLVKAIHDKIASRHWELNKPGSPVWMTELGLMANHPYVLKEALAALEQAGEVAFDRDPEHAVQSLSDFDILTRDKTKSREPYVWDIRIHAAGPDGQPVVIPWRALRFDPADIVPSTIVRPSPVQAINLNTVAPGSSQTPAPVAPRPPIVPQPGPGLVSPAPTTPGPTSGRAPTAPPSSPDNPPSGTPATPSGADAPASSSTETAESGSYAPQQTQPMVIPNRTGTEDARDQTMRDAAKGVQQRLALPQTRAEAEAWLKDPRHVGEGEILFHITRRLARGELRLHQDVHWAKQRIHLTVPNALRGLGIREDAVIERFKGRGWVDAPDNPRGLTPLQLEGEARPVPTVRLNDAVSTVLSRLLDLRREPEKKEIRKGNTAPRRELLCGPDFPPETAAKLHNARIHDQRDGYLVRPAVFAGLCRRTASTGQDLAALPPEQLLSLLRQIIAEHQMDPDWLFAHLANGDLPVLTAIPAEQHPERIALNPHYEPTADWRSGTQFHNGHRNR